MTRISITGARGLEWLGLILCFVHLIVCLTACMTILGNCVQQHKAVLQHYSTEPNQAS